MRSHLRYLSYVLRHKWFVLVAGLKIGAPLWRLLIHDWSKFTRAEWGPYVRYFYGAPAGFCTNCGRPYKPDGDNGICTNPQCVSFGESRASVSYERPRAWQAAFDRAWLHHQHANPHHWQHWVLREDNGGTKVLSMPRHFAREMVADWMGAGRAITGKWEAAEWYMKNIERIQLSPDTRVHVERLLGVTCLCGAKGSSELTCRHFGYCEAYMTALPPKEEVHV